MTGRYAAALGAVALVLTACGPTAEGFREADPSGFDACSAFADAQGAGGEVYHDLISQAATLGTKASTTPVRKAVDGEGDGAPVIHDLGAFKDACEDAGFSFG